MKKVAENYRACKFMWVQRLNIKGKQRDIQFKKVDAVSEKAIVKYEETDSIIACLRKKLDLWKHSVCHVWKHDAMSE